MCGRPGDVEFACDLVPRFSLPALHINLLLHELFHVQPTEPDVTRFMAGLDGKIEQLVIEEFCAKASASYMRSLRLISGVEFRRESPGSDARRAIDLVVIDTAEERKSTIAVEAKFDALVNGRFAYYREAPGEYSNQVICYTHGCTNARLDASVKFLWLGLGLGKDGSPWGRKGVNEDDASHLAHALAEQEKARPLWHPIAWTQLWTSVASVCSEYEEVVGEALLRALGATRAH